MATHILTSPPSADVNWLLSTAVQSGAALVAIIGGLIVARLVGLTGERGAARRQMSAAQDRLKRRRDQLSELNRQYEILLAHQFIRKFRDEIFDAHGAFSPEELGRLELKWWALADPAKAEVVLPYMARVREAFATIEALLDGTNPRGVDEDEFLSEIEAFYSQENTYRSALAQLRSEAPMNLQRFGVPAMDIDFAGMEPGAEATRGRQRDEAQAESRQAAQRVTEAEIQIEDAARALRAASRPEGITRTAIALLVLTLTCLVFPLVLMAWGRTNLPASPERR